MEKNFDLHELETIANHAFSHRFNHTLHAYIDIANDLVAGTLLNQIIYWFTPDQNGRRKVRVFKDGYYWLAKSQDEWFDEIRITPKQYRTAIEKLEEKQLVIKAAFKFNGSPTTHIRPNYPVLRQEVEKWKKAVIQEMLDGDPFLTKGKKPIKSSILGDAEQQLGYLEQGSTLEPQGEAPNPLETLDFYQRSKTKLPKGQNPNLQLGKNINRDYNRDDYIEQQQTKNDVVVYQKEFEEFFKKQLKTETAVEFARVAKKNGKDLRDYIHYVKDQSKKKEILNPVGYLREAVIENWDVPSVAERELAAAKEASRKAAERKKYENTAVAALIAAGIDPQEVGY